MASWSAASCFTNSFVADSEGPKYLADALPSSPRPAYQSPKPWMTFVRPSRVGSSSVLKSWSRSTIEVVESSAICAPSSSSASLSGPGDSAM